MRITPAIETTGTFKYRKVDLVRDGFDPAKIEQTLYFDDPTEHRMPRSRRSFTHAFRAARSSFSARRCGKGIAKPFKPSLAPVCGASASGVSAVSSGAPSAMTLSSAHQQHAMRNLRGERHVVRREDDRAALLACERATRRRRQALARDQGQRSAHRAASSGACCASARARCARAFSPPEISIHAARGAARRVRRLRSLHRQRP
jgi:hypothetical protein